MLYQTLGMLSSIPSLKLYYCMKKKIIVLLVVFSGSFCIVNAQTRVIAHRGYWETSGSAQNSLAALQKAQTLSIYGSEFDVWITSDGIPVVNHDAIVDSLRVEDETFERLQYITLTNGEKIPTLEQYLEQGSKLPDIQLVLEIKSHKRIVNEDRLVSKVVEMVQSHQLEDRVDYISFSMNICKELKHILPNATIVYLNGDVSPTDLKALGLSGLDYSYKALSEHPDWIDEARSLGLTTNVWTVNDTTMMKSFINKGIDFITTDNPVALSRLLAK